ncbi:MAG: phosphoenolpyruvate--protein phosphotransferase [Lachnospira sp.]
MLRGIGTSNGIGIGKVLLLPDENVEAETYSVEDTSKEIDRFENALNTFLEETERLVCELGKKLGEKNRNALVLQNQIYLAKDISFIQGVKDCIKDNNICAEGSVDKVCADLTDIFLKMDSEAMHQRVSDIADMKSRMLSILTGRKKLDLTHLPDRTVLVAKQLHPSVTACMDMEHVVGIVAEKGGETSHASILARALEIPAVLSVKNISQMVSDEMDIIVDGAYGEVFLKPSNRTVAIYEKKKKAYEELILELKEYVNKNTQTKDGVKVMLAANIGGASEASMANSNGAEGVGLFRTEFLFMNRVNLPTEEEQFEEYKKAAILMKGKPLTIRTLDIGGDKDIPYMGLSKENNPFLGYRAIRFCLDRVDVFTAQLRAIYRASAFGNIRIMIPMVSSLSEIHAVKRILEGIRNDLDKNEVAYDKNIKLGVMIETPAAALIADVLAKEVDFFSIGTNDLTQYTMAVDRCNENVSYLYSEYNPAVLRLISHIIKCAHKAEIEVAMCGEAAGKEGMIPLLLAFGLDEFSVSPSRILETRKNIASWTMKEAEEVTGNVMGYGTVKEVTDFLSDYLAERNKRN